jgi:hypothetical protein
MCANIEGRFIAHITRNAMCAALNADHGIGSIDTDPDAEKP